MKWAYAFSKTQAVWPDWAIFCTLGNHSKPVATIFLPKSPTLLGNNKASNSFIFLLKSFLGNFYRQFAIFIWSHWTQISLIARKSHFGKIRKQSPNLPIQFETYLYFGKFYIYQKCHLICQVLTTKYIFVKSFSI